MAARPSNTPRRERPAAGAGAPPSSPVAVLARCWRSVVWYLEGMMGADAYKRYLEHQARTHPDREPMTERQFWKDKSDWEERNPQGRCC